MTNGYVGRFAPTPSGPLHFGSLLTAVASWLDARAHGGRWLLRIDDLDAPRVVPGAEDAILDALAAHGLHWDGAVCRQSDYAERHRAALDALREHVFACACTRKALRGAQRCPGPCRGLRLPQAGNAVRLRAEGEHGGTLLDRVQGHYREPPDAIGDFVVWRRDDMASYPLAVVVDDAAMGVTDIVRGADLLPTTPNQLRLIAHLGVVEPSAGEREGLAPPMKEPRYGHIPVVAEASGVKLSKHNAATAIDARFTRHNLAAALALLGLHPPAGDVHAMLAWAVGRWRIEQLPATAVMPGFVALG